MRESAIHRRLIAGDVVAEVSVNRVEFRGNSRSPVSVGVGGSTGSYGSGIGMGVGINLNALGDQRGVETTLNVRILRRSDNLVIWEGRGQANVAHLPIRLLPSLALLRRNWPRPCSRISPANRRKT